MHNKIKEIVRCIGIEKFDAEIATRNRETISEILPIVVKEFYEHLDEIGMSRLFRSVDMARLQARQIEHWRELFRADFGDVYANRVTRIGIVHRDHEITPQVYMQSYGWFTSRLVERLVAHPGIAAADRARLAGVVLKLVHLDMTMALASYDAALID